MEKKPDKVFTNTFVLNKNQSKILLGMKKLRFGAGWYNGFGGKARPGKDIVTEAKRELKSESGLTSIKLEKIGILRFEFKIKPALFVCHVFITDSDNCKGKLKETPEMRPEWFKIELIPYNQMWAGDKLWLPFVVENKKFRGEIFYDSPEGNNILNYRLEVVNKI